MDAELTPNSYTHPPATPLRNRGTQEFTLPGPAIDPNVLDTTPRYHLGATPRRLFSPPSLLSPHRGAPYFHDLSLENPFSFSPNFHSSPNIRPYDFSLEDPFSISPDFRSRPNISPYNHRLSYHLNSPTILGRRERSSSPSSTRRNRRRFLTFGSSHTLDEVDGPARGADTERDAAIGVGEGMAIGTGRDISARMSIESETGAATTESGMAIGSETGMAVKSARDAAESARGVVCGRDMAVRTETSVAVGGGERVPIEGERCASVDRDAGVGGRIIGGHDDGSGSDYEPRENTASRGHGGGRGGGRGRRQGPGLNVTSKNSNRGRGRGGGIGTGAGRGRVANMPWECKTHGGAAPPVWTYDPRPALDTDLGEEDFHRAQNVQTDSETQQTDDVPRGSYIRPEPENQVLSSPGYHFVLDLAMACRKYHLNGPGEENPISQIFELLKTASTVESARIKAASQIGSIIAVDSLENIAKRCAMAEQNSTVMDFVFMINAIQLRCKVIRFVFLIYICIVYSNLVLNLVFVTPRDGRRHLFLNRSRV